jgi:putative methyltransferase (TIGR04325 family)
LLIGITPPYVRAAARRIRGKKPWHAWEYLGTEWVDDGEEGWSSTSVADHYAQKLPTFRSAIEAPNCIGVPTEALLACEPGAYDQNIALEYAYAVTRAAGGRDRLSILDWGGGFGYMAIVVRELFPDLDVDFHVKEVPSTAEAARRHVADVTFWDDDSCLARSYDLVSACGSFQYSPDWRAQLGRFGAAAPFVLLTRTPVAITARSFLVRQQAYGTSYVGWVFSRSELLNAARHAGLSLVRELQEGFSAGVPGAPARDEHHGYLFRHMSPDGTNGP